MASYDSNGTEYFEKIPTGQTDALATLYMQKQDLSGKTPEEFTDMYVDAYNRIYQEINSLTEKKREAKKSQKSHSDL